MKTIILLFSLFTLLSCGETESEKTEIPKDKQKVVNEEDLIKIKDGIFYEYYPDGKSLKFTGPQDKDGKRDGTWYYYSETGLELSMTVYKNGIKNGHSVVKYPDGRIHYYGEYKDDKMIGVWKTYDEKGKIVSEVNYDTKK
jgi:antitoxin component YwqK of YwqJK toxin-antitoxin module